MQNVCEEFICDIRPFSTTLTLCSKCLLMKNNCMPLFFACLCKCQVPKRDADVANAKRFVVNYV